MDDKNLKQRGTENNVEGKGKDLKGRVKDAVGGLTGDSSLQAEGKLDRAEGNIQDKFGKAQREVGESDR